jgi:hypothetical protein
VAECSAKYGIPYEEALALGVSYTLLARGDALRAEQRALQAEFYEVVEVRGVTPAPDLKRRADSWEARWRVYEAHLDAAIALSE